MRTILVILAIITMSTTCNKEAGEGETDMLAGKWAKKQTLISPGPMGEWEPYVGAPAFLILRDDGTAETTGAGTIDKKYNRYTVDSKFIRFFKEASTDTLRTGYGVENGELTIWLPCIEPCGIKFKRVK